MTVYNYWLICYVPDTARPDRVSAGVVVSGTLPGEVAFRGVPKATALPAVGDSREQFYQVLLALEEDLLHFAQPDELPLGAHHQVFNFMERQRRQNYGLIQFEEPGLVVEADVATAADKLYNRLVHHPEMNEHSPRRVTQLRKAAISAYAEFDLLKDKVVSNPALSVKNFRDKVDLAVVSDQVWEISSAFSFRNNADKPVQDRIRSWSYTMAKLRDSGGVVEPKKGNRIEVTPEVPIRAVIDKPKGEKQRDLYVRVVDEWEEIGIDHVFKEDLSTHAAKLNHRLASVA